MNDPFVLKIDSALENLEQVRRFIDRAANELDVSPETVSDIRLAVDEAVTNIIVHGYKGREDGEIVLSVARRQDGIQVSLVDSAPLVDPTTIVPRALTDIQPGRLDAA